MSELTPWQRLLAASLVEGEAPLDEQPHWSSRFLLGIVGWLAALFLLFFLFMAFEGVIREADHALAMGAILMAAALGLNRKASRGDLWDQFVLALALAADAWLLYGLIDRVDLHSAILWLGLCALSLGIAALFEHWLIRLFHSFAAAILLTLGLACLGLQLLALPLVMAVLTACWLLAERQPSRHQLYESLTLGLALSLLVLGRLHHPLWDGGASMLDELGHSRLPLWINPLLCAALLLGVMVRLKLPLLYGLPLVLISALIPGMGAGALVLVLGFYAGSLGLMTLAGLLLLGFGSLYYYDLGLTLMTKSWLLLGSGALLLGARQLLKILGKEIPS
ncbi:Uncharacterized membrane-anchored protein [Aeromonas encheleia]|uniref:DUF4401 domain-containing protein n=1 Tax=Aeromonas TaxID=642 RepID=UPI0005B1EA2B|nr:MULTISPECIES: DUF4401 domain-containing protein [Aeromonas]MBV7598983.1 DUF4401 domain-containing protein [Aeromonas sp. sia0103]VEG96993.1 Uncharacterized membrane-anchored protein [Aeromonas encheleia]